MQSHRDAPPVPTITVALTTQQAWAYSQFLKRIGLTDYRSMAVDSDEAFLMLDAGEVIRNELHRVGYAPR